jgi:DNA-binding NarL/FixJ family response regulator
MADLRILVIADDPLARAGLATLLAGQAGCAIVGQVSGSDDLTAAVKVHRPDVLLWDVGWNPGQALERLAQIGESPLPVAALLPDEAHVTQAWSAGARALLRRDADPAQITAALAAIAQGLTVIAPDFAAVLSFPAGPREPKAWVGPDAAPLVEELTPRELAVLRLVAEGLPNKTIALRLGISEHTVKFHVNAILGKLGVASRTEAVVRATRLGLILL